MPTELPLQRITLQVTLPGITDPDRILKQRDQYDWYELTSGDGLLGLFFARRSHPEPPDWLRFVLPYMDTGTRNLGLLQASSAAVALVQRGDRVFVLVFGTGRSMLAHGVFEDRFGLKTTLNSVARQELRSIDRKTFSEVQRHTREDVSRAAGLEAFGIDVEQDLLRGVTGGPSDRTLGHTMAGLGPTLTVSARTTLEGLVPLLDRYLELHERKDYQDHFGWVDNIGEVRDPAKAEALFEALINRIQRGETDRIWLAPPDLLSWTGVRGFAYSQAKSAEEFDDLRLEQYLADRRRGADMSVAHLSSDHVFCLSVEGGGWMSSWPVKNCLCADLDVGEDRFVLTDGKWYQIAPKYAKAVHDAVQELKPTATVLPPYTHENEDAYNRSAEKASKGELALLHERLVDTGTPRGAIEVCDLYSRQRRFIHIKRYGGSSVLSHLFAQGVVSADMFFSDRTFRRSVNNKLPDSHKLADPNAPLPHGAYEVAYAIVGPTARPLKLPFFSALNLKNAARLLASWGYRVTLTEIRNASVRRASSER